MIVYLIPKPNYILTSPWPKLGRCLRLNYCNGWHNELTLLSCQSFWKGKVKEILYKRNNNGYEDFTIWLIVFYFYKLRIRERVNYLSCIEEKKGLQDINCKSQRPRYLFLYYKIYFSKVSHKVLICQQIPYFRRDAQKLKAQFSHKWNQTSDIQ